MPATLGRQRLLFWEATGSRCLSLAACSPLSWPTGHQATTSRHLEGTPSSSRVASQQRLPLDLSRSPRTKGWKPLYCFGVKAAAVGMCHGVAGVMYGVPPPPKAVTWANQGASSSKAHVHEVMDGRATGHPPRCVVVRGAALARARAKPATTYEGREWVTPRPARTWRNTYAAGPPPRHGRAAGTGPGPRTEPGGWKWHVPAKA